MKKILLLLMLVFLVGCSGANNSDNLSAGEIVLINENVKPWECSSNGDSCSDILVTMEVDLTEDSKGDELEGRFYIRAYDGGDYLNSPKIGELQITQTYNPFGGDEVLLEDNSSEILRVVESEDYLYEEDKFKNKFNLEYMESVPGWDISGYILKIENEEQVSDLNGRFVDFYYSDGEMSITVPQ